MHRTFNFGALLVFSLVLFLAQPGLAQQDSASDAPASATDEPAATADPGGDTTADDAGKPTAGDEAKEPETEEDTAAKTKPESPKGETLDDDVQENASPVQADSSGAEGIEKIENTIETSEDVFDSDSPIAGLQDSEFVPLEDIEEEVLEDIIPSEIYPHIEWSGAFRVRSLAEFGLDLGTSGTSLVESPSERTQPSGAAADREANTLWSTDLRLRLDPTLNISDSLAVHTEFTLFDNVVMGSSPTTSPSGLGGLGQLTMGPLAVTELYGEISTLLGRVRVGRMDDHWGLGAYFNDGDCLDCEYSNPMDRLEFETQFAGWYGAATVDFPNEGPSLPSSTSQSSGSSNRSVDSGQIDDMDQWTLRIESAPRSREEKQMERHRLVEEDALVINGGLMVRYATQEGSAQDGLIYLGLERTIASGWLELLYEPELHRRLRIAIEGIGVLGTIENASGAAVGQAETDEDSDINCFDEATRSAASSRCVDSEQLQRFGAAFESGLEISKSLEIGLDSGFASGGWDPNWGYGQVGGDFLRFNPDYIVDLILFRRVIGTVTNAVYYKPHVTGSFLETSDRHMEFEIAPILSHAFRIEGTPSGDDAWLGLEIDGALRYIVTDLFQATLEAGILFPFQGLAAKAGETPVKSAGLDSTQTFSQDVDPDLAWTVQGKLVWSF